MKKSIFTKITVCFMAILMVLSLIGCGKEKGKNKEPEKKETKDMTYAAELIKTEGAVGDISTFFVKGDRVYFDTFVWTAAENEDEEPTVDARYYSVKTDGTDLKEIEIPEFEEAESISSWVVNDDGSMLFLLTKYDMKSEEVFCRILKVDAEGNELWTEDVTKALKMKEKEQGVLRMLTDENGKIVIALTGETSGEICILDENAKYIDSINSKNRIEAVAKTKEGKIVGCYSEKEEQLVQEINIEGKKWGKAYKIDVPYFRGSNSLKDGMEYDFYYETDSGIYGYNMEEESAIEIFDFLASNMTTETFGEVKSLTGEQFVGTRYDAEFTKLYLFKKVDPSAVKERKTITFAGVYMNEELKMAAIEFNRTNKDYRIELLDYNEVEVAEEKMNADIAAGKIPDIYDFSCQDMMRENFAAKGMLEDLMPYIEKDEEISEEDFCPTMLEAMKMGDKLYSFSPSFSIVTIIGKSSVVGENIGWTFEDMKAVLQEHGNAKLFSDNDRMSRLFSFEHTFNDFIDWENGSCSFDSSNFKDVLEFCKDGTAGEGVREDTDVRAYQNNEILLEDIYVKKDWIGLHKKEFGEDITYIGYPNKDKTGGYFWFYSEVGISSKSEVKEGAWQFVRMLMTRDYQSKRSEDYDGMPIRKDSLEMMEKALMATEKYTDELGRPVYPLDSSASFGGFEVEIKPLPQEDIDQFNDLIAHIHVRSFSNRYISEIIEEEVQPYFAGEKDVDTTADIIQSRITTYINESR